MAIPVAIIVVAVFLIPRPTPNRVQLQPYLDHCVTGSLLYHSHPNLAIIINGQVIVIPVTFEPSCAQPIHTHDSSGVLHVERAEPELNNRRLVPAMGTADKRPDTGDLQLNSDIR